MAAVVMHANSVSPKLPHRIQLQPTSHFLANFITPSKLPTAARKRPFSFPPRFSNASIDGYSSSASAAVVDPPEHFSGLPSLSLFSTVTHAHVTGDQVLSVLYG